MTMIAAKIYVINREPVNFRFNTSGVFSPYQGWYQRLCYCFTRCKGNGIVLEWSQQLLHLNAHLAQLLPLKIHSAMVKEALFSEKSMEKG